MKIIKKVKLIDFFNLRKNWGFLKIMSLQNPVIFLLKLQKSEFSAQQLMKNLEIFVLFGLIVLASSTGLWLNTRSAEYKRYDAKWNTLHIPCNGGSGSLQYKFQLVPSYWDFKGDLLYIPSSSVSNANRFQIRVLVYDIIYRISLVQYVIIELQQTLSVNLYLRSSYDPNYNIAYTYQRNDRNSYVFPSQSEVNRAIQQGDTTQINGFIMKAIDSDNDCDEKKQFLTLVLNRIQFFLASYQSGISTLQAEIASYERQIASIEKQIALLESSVNQEIYLLTNELNNVESTIDWLQKQLNDDQQDIKQYKLEKAELKNKIWQIEDVSIQALEKEVRRLQFELSEIRRAQGYDSSKKSYYTRYSRHYYDDQQNRLEDQIARKKRQIEDLKSSVISFQAKFQWLEKKIIQISSRKTENQRKISQYKTKRSQLRSKISQAKYNAEDMNKKRGLEAEIRSLRSQISKNKYEIQQSKTASAILQANLKKIRMQVDEFYYQCEDVKYDEVSVVNSTFQVTFTPAVFQTYVRTSYGVDISTLGSGFSFATYSANRQIPVRKCNIYSNSWITSYGRPTTTSTYRYGTYSYSNSNSYTNNFTCRRSGAQYRGRINRISGNNIWANYNGYDHQLVIGDCTTLETSTGYSIPRVNDYIIWVGTTPSPRTHYVHSGICI